MNNFQRKCTLAFLYASGWVACASAQELYVFSEPASNMPAKSVSVKTTGKFLKAQHLGRIEQRYTPEIMLGLSKRWMLHGATTFSNMYSHNIQWESARVYGKYRFLSNDEVHRHFRMAVFGEFSYSRNRPHYEELSLEGDQRGAQAGVIATQLINRIAFSSSIGFLKTGDNAAGLADTYADKALTYSLSSGYLVFPFTYSSFKQTNMNLYMEILGQQTIDKKKYLVDLAPAVQLIFGSNFKLNTGYRFQLSGNMRRMAENSWLVSFEYTFLNVIKHKVR